MPSHHARIVHKKSQTRNESGFVCASMSRAVLNNLLDTIAGSGRLLRQPKLGCFMIAAGNHGDCPFSIAAYFELLKQSADHLQDGRRSRFGTGLGPQPHRANQFDTDDGTEN